MGYKIARWIIRLLISLIARVRVENIEYVPEEGGFIIASNHVGRLDAPLVYYLLDRRDVVMLVAEKYRKYGFYRWFVKRLDAIWVDRFNADLGAMRAALQRLKAGWVMVLAPEGTRSRTGELQEARPGTSYLAAKAGVPILPAALIGSEDRNVIARLRRLRRVEITIRVGPPFKLPPLRGRDRELALQEYTDEIMVRIAALLPDSQRGVYRDHPRLQALVQEHNLA